MLKKNGRALIADEMGLGKTIQVNCSRIHARVDNM